MASRLVLSQGKSQGHKEVLPCVSGIGLRPTWRRECNTQAIARSVAATCSSSFAGAVVHPPAIAAVSSAPARSAATGLTYWVLLDCRNLNAEPRGWALADASVDAVLCCASVQYMQQPEAVFAEIARVLRPGGVVIIAFSNRMFYTKVGRAGRTGGWVRVASASAMPCLACLTALRHAPVAAMPFAHTPPHPSPPHPARFSMPAFVSLHPAWVQAIAAWRDNSDFGRCSLVKSYMAATDAFTDPEVIKSVELPDQGPLQRLQQWGQTLLAGGASDPFFAVVAHKR